MENCLVYLETTQSKIIKVLFEVLKEVFMGHVNLIFNKKGVQLKTFNGTKKSIVFLNLYGEEFEEFLCTEQEFIAGVDTTNLHKITKSINTKDLIKIFVTKDDRGSMNLIRINSETGCKYTHKIKLYNVPYSKLNIPPTNFFHSLTLKSVEFQIACKNLNNLNCENVNVIFKKDSIILNSSNDFSETNIELKQQQDEAEMLDLENGVNCENQVVCGGDEEENILFDDENQEVDQGNYLLQYILLFTKATTLDKNFEIFLNPEKPLTMSYAVGSLGHLDFMLEPNFTLSEDEEYISE